MPSTIAAKKFVLHVGMHKTGTTTLQHDIFPRLPGVRVFCDSNEGDADFIAWLRRVAWANPAAYDPEAVAGELERFIAGVVEETVLISFEELFGDLYWNFPNNFLVAGRLHQLFPGARLILVVRRQAEWLESAWRQSLKSNQFRGIKAFLNYRDGTFHGRGALDYRASISALELDYRPYASNYAKLFGRDNVKLLAFELLQRDPDRFYASLFEFIGVGVPAALESTRTRNVHNRAYSGLACMVALVLNRFTVSRFHVCGFLPDRPFFGFFSARRGKGRFYRIMASISGRLSVSYFLQNGLDRLIYLDWPFMNERMRTQVFDSYREPNRLLDEEFGLGLAELGYY